MNAALSNALHETLAMIPWLLGIYIALELLERRAEHVITKRLSLAAKAGPLLGALFGCIPQCGFSVIASALYAQRNISLGTLLSVYLSTSDEALPVILAQWDKWDIVLKVLVTKIVIATVAGFTIDFFHVGFSKSSSDPILHPPIACNAAHRHCCGHDHTCREPWWKSFVLFPLKHTLQVLIFIFLISWGLNALLQHASSGDFTKFFFASSPFQPIISVLIGLIPNCAASVAITEIYLKGGISFGSAIAGLCASAGLGILVLFKENKDLRETAKIIGLLAGISLLAGWILNLFQ